MDGNTKSRRDDMLRSGLGAQGPKALEPIKEPPTLVCEALGNLTNNIDTLGSQIAAMEDKLLPVLSPYGNGIAGNLSEKDTSRCAVTEQINLLARRIEGLGDIVDAILNRIAL